MDSETLKSHKEYCIGVLNIISVVKDEKGWKRIQSLGDMFQNISWERAQNDARMACIYIMFPSIVYGSPTIEALSGIAPSIELLVRGVPEALYKDFQKPNQGLLSLFDRKKCSPQEIKLLINYGWLKE